MEEKVVKPVEKEKTLESTPGWLWLTLIVICISMLLFVVINYYRNNNDHPKKEGKAETESTVKSSTERPNTYTETYTLKKGDLIRVYKPDGYTCNYYGGGKKYYCQPQNSEKIILGGGDCSNMKMFSSKYVDLSFYEEEITVVCEFIKVN